MAKSFKVVITTPDAEAWTGDVVSATIPGLAGYLGVWANHAPLVGAVTPGLNALIADPDGALRRASSVAREQAGRKRFYRVATGPGEPDLYVKVFSLPSVLARARYFLRPSKARREARIARRIAERGFEAARLEEAVDDRNVERHVIRIREEI